jgi:hypothetical protein
MDLLVQLERVVFQEFQTLSEQLDLQEQPEQLESRRLDLLEQQEELEV